MTVSRKHNQHWMIFILYEFITPNLIPPSDTVSMKTKNTESESLWTKAPVANLVRYEPSGIYFACAKVRGKLVRKSLDTNVLSVAKLRLADVLDTEHKAVAPSQTKIVGKMIFADALAIFNERQKHATDIKDSTKRYNERAAHDLLKTWGGLEQMDVKRISKFDYLEWRARFGKMYSPTVTNGTLSVLRRVLDIAVDSGVRYDNPAKDKDVKRARVRRKELQLPEPDQFLALVKKVRTAGSRDSDNCGDAIEFFSYVGARLSEAAKIYGRDCSFLKNEIIIRGDPITGTKNWEMRRVPMIPEVRKLLERLKAERGENEFLDNPVLKVRKFNRSLKNACKKLGLFHLTHHDLRHLFATRCIESGVDIPTVAKWLGHKDGGVLAMQTAICGMDIPLTWRRKLFSEKSQTRMLGRCPNQIRQQPLPRRTPTKWRLKQKRRIRIHGGHPTRRLKSFLGRPTNRCKSCLL
jgi:integrase